MSVLDDENIVLSDNTFIVDEVKKWFAKNVFDIVIEQHGHDKMFKPIFGDFDIAEKRFGFLNKLNYLKNLDDDEFSRFIKIDFDSFPMLITIEGDLYMNSTLDLVPCELFVIHKINGNLDLSWCELESTDGLPDRENILGKVDYIGSDIKFNKYENFKKR